MTTEKITDEERQIADFITLFNVLWYRDSPIHKDYWKHSNISVWTKHIDSRVKLAADMLGLFTHFEEDGRYDAIIKDNGGEDIIALEWEWNEPIKEGNELKKLAEHKTAKNCVLISYSSKKKEEENKEAVKKEWESRGAKKPLYFICVIFEADEKEKGMRNFLSLHTYKIGKEIKLIREQKALPWDVEGSKWFIKKDEEE